jgi:hypothetical protein
VFDLKHLDSLTFLLGYPIVVLLVQNVGYLVLNKTINSILTSLVDDGVEEHLFPLFDQIF